ncbi:Copper chaperone CopZ [bioreactor metagenome]|uniref:Copper chaperone CopZ n=1 Tax=bioreactor metagenome TaxID=1076179 RepID=A0A644YS89_9ZZZZ|nr:MULTISPECIES: copper ion binding protein [Oscillibacter]MEA4992957.1 copper ion binding protein [Oscillibacter sp.]MEA5042507.1 copper ion binding protein [Oscillibacter ruminantium]
MAKSVVNVDGMSCEHCVKAITNAVSALPGVSDVAVDLKAKTVTVEHAPELSLEKIKNEIEEQGYDIIS